PAAAAGGAAPRPRPGDGRAAAEGPGEEPTGPPPRLPAVRRPAARLVLRPDRHGRERGGAGGPRPGPGPRTRRPPARGGLGRRAGRRAHRGTAGHGGLVPPREPARAAR